MTNGLDERPRLVVVTGLSGSGKSSVGNALEDLGYYTVDNLPLPLLETFLQRAEELVPGHRHIAVVTDVRAPGFHEELPRLLRDLDRNRLDDTLLFLEASDETLVRRFSETRRPHPLAVDRPVIEGIRRERELLAELRGLADRVLDTDEWTIHDVRNQVYRTFAVDPTREAGMMLSLTSFGFKHGIPYGTDMLFDVRFLPNPYFVSGLREQSGRDAEVQEFLDDFRVHRLADGRRRLVRNGYLPEREIQTGLGTVAVQIPKVRDRASAGGKFNSALVPPSIRRTASVEAVLPWLSLKGLSTGDFTAALQAL